MSTSIEIFPDSGILVGAAGRRLVEAIQTAVAARGRALIVLTGGGNGTALLRYLGTQRSHIDWSKVHLFWGDERFVPADHPASNYRMAADALLRHVPLLPDHVFPIPTQAASPDAAADAYEATLRSFFDTPEPAFDLTLLGLGDDGHTASLFPEDLPHTHDDPARWVEAVVAPLRYEIRPRITLTLPALNASRYVFFLVAGEGKREVLRAVLDQADPTLPAAHVRAREQLTWFVDEAAFQSG